MHLKVRKRSGQKGWVLKLWEYGKEHYVSRDKFPDGLKSDMTIEQARRRIKTLNASLRPLAQTKRLQALKRHHHRMAVKHALLPRDVVSQYESNNILFLKDDDPTRRRRELIWAAAQKIICDLNIHPSDWSLSVDVVYDYFTRKKYSWDYSQRIVSAMNRYGHLYCRLMQKSFFPLELNDQKKRAVIEASFGDGYESEPLSVDALRDLQNKIPDNKFNWLWIAFWFGLRPQEVDMLKSKLWSDGMPTWWLEDQEKTLVVYQPKLQMVKPKKRYRRIPLKFPEQNIALQMTRSGSFERPLIKQAVKWLPERVSLYGCRHGFACYMDSRGIDIYAISRWLGHQSVKTTERYYVRLGMKRDTIAERLLPQDSFASDFSEILKNFWKIFLRAPEAPFKIL